ncbi:beta-lactamase/transpeptidase-like protein, partial [Aureobasidium melanogenum]|uniref:Beta-lactamase/transpeptidase-like protein n=1 Tax=Aureobasidium melanogenum (strain CBS 110374) TaxID=1043003 RepID=A0A074VBL3_AURM1
MTTTIDHVAQERLQKIADSYVSREYGIPGLVFCVVDSAGNQLSHCASGRQGHDLDCLMDENTRFWFASCTKMITAIAAMQLVEANEIRLDDGDQLEQILWELQDRKVLVEDAKGQLSLVDKRTKITLRMLLSHTAGFGYSFSNSKLKKWSEPRGILEVSSDEHDIFEQPLVNQPGTMWEYGTNMDWVGRLIERITSMSLGEYMKKHIFDQIGVSSLTFFPSSDTLAYLHERMPSGQIKIRDCGHLLRRAIQHRQGVHEPDLTFLQAGGHGLFGTPSDYCQIISILLNKGVHAPTGTRILQEGTVQQMLENQIPEHRDFARDLSRPCKPSLVNYQAETYAQPREEAQGWGMSFFKLLHSSKTGRRAGTVWWSGLANLIWWADIDSGIGGILASQILPFGDDLVFSCYEELETALYNSIEQAL